MNTLAYLASSSAMKEKRFITLTPGGPQPILQILEGDQHPSLLCCGINYVGKKFYKTGSSLEPNIGRTKLKGKLVRSGTGVTKFFEAVTRVLQHPA
jgi:hypothetical protein